MKNYNLAVSASFSNSMPVTNFMDADKFLIYEFKNNEFCFKNEIINYYKMKSSDQLPQKYTDAITHILKEYKVKVIISSSFDTSKKIIGQQFIPCIINDTNINRVLDKAKQCLAYININKSQNKLYEFRRSLIKSTF